MKENRTAPTLDDVARAAGVSTATVSRVLNGSGKVAESTRSKVEAAVNSLGYLPHFGARAMAANRTQTIGAIIPTMENAIFARGIQAFQEALHDRGYTLLVASSSYSMEMEKEQVRALVARGADGLLLIGQDRDPEILAFLQRHGIPWVAAWSYDPAGKIPTVGFDNHKAMHALARKALEMGHRAIGMISAPTATNDRARDRVAAVRRAMRDAGLPDAALQLVETAYGIETGARAFKRLLEGSDRPTMIFCGNDVLAVGALLEARKIGLDVPGQVSVTGFDDIDLARITHPALTTVHVPHRAMGTQAAHVLIDLLQNGTIGENPELATDIVLRDSLAPPPRS